MILNSASKICVVSEQFFNSKVDGSFTNIPNGYDETDLKEEKFSRNTRFKIRYMGSLKDRQYIDTFFKVLEDLSSDAGFNGKIDLEIIGKVHKSVKQRILEKNYGDFKISFMGYQDHDEALKFIAQADALLFIIGKGPRGKFITTGKLYEYMMVMKPIIAFGPLEGEANKIITSSKLGKMFDYNDGINVKKQIIFLYKNWEKNKTCKYDMEILKQYSRRNLTGKLVELFKDEI